MITSVQYDTTGNILNCTFEDDTQYAAKVAAGLLLLEVPNMVDISTNKVDLTTTPPSLVSIPFTIVVPPPVQTQPLPTVVIPAAPVVSNTRLLALNDIMLSGYWNGDLQVNIGTTGTPIIAIVDVSSQGRADVLGLSQAFAGGATTEPWYQSTGTLTITTDQLNIISIALKNYVQSALAVWQQAVDALRSTPPTITTYDELNALAWPPKAQP